MQMVLTGTGTSHGVPVIGCHCKVCQSPDPRDKRLRCSAYITHTGKDGSESHIIIDTGPEFRIQALTYHIEKADCVLLTHSHADHLDGLDDLRVFCHSQSSQHEASPGPGLPVYGNPQTLADTKNRFDYIFKPTQLGGGKPKLDLEDCSRFTPDSPLIIGDVSILPVPMKHGVIDTTGWLMSVNGSDGCRSEEHTSELQSPDQLVCRLLLEKQKTFLPLPPHQRSRIQVLWIDHKGRGL